MPRIIGHNTRLLVAINAETAGMTFDGAAGTPDCIRIKSGGFSYEERLPKEVIDEMMVDPRDYIKGGKVLTWTMEIEWSFSYREKLLQLVMGGAIGTGGSGPYTHTPALATKLLNGELAVEYTDQAAQANEVFSDTFANAVVTAFSLKGENGKSVKGTLSGIATGRVHAENGVSLTTVQNTEKVSWRHLTPEVDGTNTYRIGDLSVDVNVPVAEDAFGMAGSNPATQEGNFRSGPREVTWGVKMWASSDVLAQIGDTGEELIDNVFTWDNGLSGADNRQFVVTLGDSHITSAPRKMGVWSREPIDVKCRAMNGTTPVIAFTCINGRITIPA